jgi:hypothetical protein
VYRGMGLALHIHCLPTLEMGRSLKTAQLSKNNRSTMGRFSNFTVGSLLVERAFGWLKKTQRTIAKTDVGIQPAAQFSNRCHRVGSCRSG